MDKVYNVFVDGELSLSTTRKSRLLSFLNEDYNHKARLTLDIYLDGQHDESIELETIFTSEHEVYVVSYKDHVNISKI